MELQQVRGNLCGLICLLLCGYCLTFPIISFSQVSTRPQSIKRPFNPLEAPLLLVSSSRYSLKQEKSESCESCNSGVYLNFTLLDNPTGKVQHFRIDNDTSQVDEIFFFGDTKIVLFGRYNGTIEIVNIYDIRANEIIDSFFYDVADISPDGRFITFIRFHPRGDPGSDIFSIYDVTATPAQNRKTTSQDAFEKKFDVGFPLFPNSVDIWRTSPFFWLDINTLIFTFSEEQRLKLAIVNLAEGSAKLHVTSSTLGSCISTDLTDDRILLTSVSGIKIETINERRIFKLTFDKNLCFKKEDINQFVPNDLATIVTLTHSQPGPIMGQPLTIFAQMYPQIASGNVTFYDEGSEVGKAQITNGKASLTTSFSSTGNHTIKAVYSGDANFLKSETTIKLEVLAPGYEADVSPSPNGNGTVTVADWVQIGRYFVGLDPMAAGSSFQRADCAPKDTKGDAALTISDWVQAGRYAVGLDPVATAGGPMTAALTANSTPANRSSAISTEAMSDRKITTIASANELGVLLIRLEAQGNENALAFGLSFNPKIVRYSSATLESEAQGSQLIINQSQGQAGRIGIALAQPAGKTFPSKATTLLRLKFEPIGRDYPNTTEVSFSDDLLRRALVDCFGNSVPASYAENLLLLRRGTTTRRDTMPRKTSPR